jgi:hypothetical protein
MNIIDISDLKQNKDAKGSYDYRDILCTAPENDGIAYVRWKQYSDGGNVIMLKYTGGDGIGFSCSSLK